MKDAVVAFDTTEDAECFGALLGADDPRQVRAIAPAVQPPAILGPKCPALDPDPAHDLLCAQVLVVPHDSHDLFRLIDDVKAVMVSHVGRGGRGGGGGRGSVTGGGRGGGEAGEWGGSWMGTIVTEGGGQG